VRGAEDLRHLELDLAGLRHAAPKQVQVAVEPVAQLAEAPVVLRGDGDCNNCYSSEEVVPIMLLSER
jgi:hypothetical protein